MLRKTVRLDRPASPTDRLYAALARVEPELWLLALTALTLDVVLTYWGLRLGLAEGNPFMGHAFETVGFAALGLVKAVVLGVAAFARECRPHYGPAISLGLAVPWLFASLVNAALLL